MILEKLITGVILIEQTDANAKVPLLSILQALAVADDFVALNYSIRDILEALALLERVGFIKTSEDKMYFSVKWSDTIGDDRNATI